MSEPKGVKRKYALSNIPIILRIVMRNILYRKRWVQSDLEIVNNRYKDKVAIIENKDIAFEKIVDMVKITGRDLCYSRNGNGKRSDDKFSL